MVYPTKHTDNMHYVPNGLQQWHHLFPVKFPRYMYQQVLSIQFPLSNFSSIPTTWYSLYIIPELLLKRTKDFCTLNSRSGERRSCMLSLLSRFRIMNPWPGEDTLGERRRHPHFFSHSDKLSIVDNSSNHMATCMQNVQHNVGTIPGL